ncbi:cytoskeletal protein binding protein [Dispira simplex]|nr:cytoskeletal protein binding protein [Dispira simplex]
MPFCDVCIALYDYQAQDAEELTVTEGTVLYLLDNTDPEWHLVKPKPAPENEANTTPETSGLVPATYIEPVPSVSTAVALYDYQAQEDEEVSLQENDNVQVLSEDDPDWTIIRYKGQAGFVPTTYIEKMTTAALLPVLPSALIIPSVRPTPPVATPPPASPLAPQPSLSPRKGNPQDIVYWSVVECAKKKRDNRKGMLGVGDDKVFYSCTSDKSPVRNWNITQLSSCTVKKDIILLTFSDGVGSEYKFQLPSKYDAKAVLAKVEETRRKAQHPHDTTPPPATAAIVPRSPSIEMVPAKVGTILYDFEPQDSEELSVRVGQTVYILDAASSPDWWTCQTIPESGAQEGITGLVPASYVQLTEKPTEQNVNDNQPLQSLVKAKSPSRTIEKIRRLSNAAASSTRRFESDIPPDQTKLRTWMDKTETFKVRAQFLGLTDDGRVKLHKENGVKIAVPLNKLNDRAIALVERETGRQLFTGSTKPGTSPRSNPPTTVTAKEHKKKPFNANFDWFDFFTLKCDVPADAALRYATTFTAERLDDSDLKSLDGPLLETLGVHREDRKRILAGCRRILGKHITGKQVSFGETSIIEEADQVNREAKDANLAQKLQAEEVSRASKTPINRNMISAIDERFERQRQIEDDELLARKLQESNRRTRKASPSGKITPISPKSPTQVLVDPFDALAEVLGDGTTSAWSPSPTTPAQPLGLGLHQRKPTTSSKRAPPSKSALSVIDPAQILQAQKQLQTQGVSSTLPTSLARTSTTASQPTSVTPTSTLGFNDTDDWTRNLAVDKSSLTQVPTSGPAGANTNLTLAVAANPASSRPPPMVPLATALPAPLVPPPNFNNPNNGRVFVPTLVHRAPPPPPRPSVPAKAMVATIPSVMLNRPSLRPMLSVSGGTGGGNTMFAMAQTPRPNFQPTVTGTGSSGNLALVPLSNAPGNSVNLPIQSSDTLGYTSSDKYDIFRQVNPMAPTQVFRPMVSGVGGTSGLASTLTATSIPPTTSLVGHPSLNTLTHPVGNFAVPTINVIPGQQLGGLSPQYSTGLALGASRTHSAPGATMYPAPMVTPGMSGNLTRPSFITSNVFQPVSSTYTPVANFTPVSATQSTIPTAVGVTPQWGQPPGSAQLVQPLAITRAQGSPMTSTNSAQQPHLTGNAILPTNQFTPLPTNFVRPGGPVTTPHHAPPTPPIRPNQPYGVFSQANWQ